MKLPRVPGLEVLRWIREQAVFALLPVIIFSSSSQDSDVDTDYRLGANAYVVKPSRMAERLEIVRRIKKYWLDMNRPPVGCDDWLSITIRRPVPYPPNE